MALPVTGPRPVTFVTSPRLSELAGVDLVLASETLQHTGSFKFRAGLANASQAESDHLIAASSGNFGQALAFACRLLGKRCTIVMHRDSQVFKIDAIRGYGAEVELVDPQTKPRAVRLAELLAEHPGAVAAYPSDGEPTLRGNESLGVEVLEHQPGFDAVVAPIGGGGIIVGLYRAARRLGSAIAIWAAEPRSANDVAESFRSGRLVTYPTPPNTIADGVRVLGLSEPNWAVVREGCRGVIEVDETGIVEATRLLFTLANLKAEPTGALSLAAVLSDPGRFRDQRVCCLITGANVDPALYAGILTGSSPPSQANPRLNSMERGR